MSDQACSILVAEDNFALSTVVRFNLQRNGFDVVVAENGQAALEAAMERQFDMVISDQQMPLLEGLELARALRRIDSYAMTPFVLLSAKSYELDSRMLKKELGILETFAKPFSPAEIVRCAQRYLAQPSTASA